MINGTYEVKMMTPLGLKKGELVLNQYGNVLTGTMVILGKETPIENGETDGENIRFSVELKTAELWKTIKKYIRESHGGFGIEPSYRL